jgi:hypothetical protein
MVSGPGRERRRGPAGGEALARSARNASWQHLSDEELLDVRICDLGVRIEGSELEPRVRQLHHELRDAGLLLTTWCYLSDEWQCPEGEPAIGIPFFLAHPRLKSLEFRMMFEVEGGTTSWGMRLLRHEAGHAFDHVYSLSRRPEWKRVFGSPRATYSPYYYPVDPHSKHHVRNVPDNYAQCHPVEDFAESFAVWLNPLSQWRTRYAGWPAMRKLRNVDRTMRALAGTPPPRRRTKPVLVAEARQLQATLRSHYQRKIRRYELDDLSFAAADLRSIFRVSRAQSPPDSAAALIRRHKRQLVDSIAVWSGAPPNRVARVLAGLARLCDEQKLVRTAPVETSLIQLSTYATALVANHLRTYSYRLTRP